MVASGAAATLVKVSVSLFHRAAPTGLAYLRHWWYGRKLLVVGQARAGKTTFIDYLRFEHFEDEKDTEKTYDEQDSPRFSVSVGKDDSLELIVQTVTDVPG